MKLLIPTDFSDCSLKAIDYAVLNFSNRPDVEFVLYHSIQTPQAGATMMKSLESEMLAMSQDSMNELVGALKQKYSEEAFTQLIEFTSISQRVADIDEGEYDYVIIGTTGASGTIGNLLGSNATAVVKNSVIPVIVVPKESKIESVDKVMFATDFENEKYRSRVQKLAKFIKDFDAKLHILYVSTKDNDVDTIENPAEFDELKKAGVSYEIDIAFAPLETLESTILDNADFENMDTLALIPHHEGFLKSLFHRSMTRQLTMHSKIPVLILK